jgi:hypothetical protein
MHNNCAQIVIMAGEMLGKLKMFCTQSPTSLCTAQTSLSFAHNLRTVCTQAAQSYTHKFNYLSPPYFSKFYTLPTGPINTTNLIKE